MQDRRRAAWAFGGLIVVTALFALIAPERAGSGRFVVLHRLLPRLGTNIEDAPDPLPSGTYLLVADDRSARQEEPLLSWVASGGRLVVTDPGSVLFDRFGVSSDRLGVFGTTELASDCVRPEVVGVRQLVVSASDRALSTSATSVGCFAWGSGRYALFIPSGAGLIVLLGGSSFMNDRFLNQADNAVFARAVLGTGAVVFGPPAPPDSSAGVWELLPRGAKVVIWGLAVAGVLFALARGRRLGRPIDEELPSPLPSSELVRATGRLYRQAHAAAFGGQLVRDRTIRRLARRLGIDPSDPHVANAIARASDLEPDDVERALHGPEPTDDGELVSLCRELEAISDRTERAMR